ncbi:glycosyltransferase family 4 protein [Pseudomonas sp. BN415]|uniref:glycosyltransferase family 4 protein n=1 Tax=Pseudomonas sp. BN415 TaxID=2567889 RepID=UPI00245735D0|nr:glycosyltransferase family 4 protein [Pseudomonas sp. BN415]MDH4580944.1 glycosyltransferase family 4 protein [Pseudomonas sp. BN415]
MNAFSSEREFPFRRLALVSNQAFSLCNFRSDFIREVVGRGVQVYAFAPDYEAETRSRVEALGAIPVSFSLSRASMNPARELLIVLKLMRKFSELNVDAVFSFFIKPVIYGGIAAWLAGIPLRYSMIEGAGYVYSGDGRDSILRLFLRHIVTRAIRLSLGFSRRVFLLNQDDFNLFITPKMARSGKVVVLPGIGVDLDYFSLSPAVQAPITFVLVARLLKEKGVYDFVAAARLVRSRNKFVRFLIVGGIDQHPSAVPYAEIRQWVDEGLIQWPGHVADVKTWVGNASVFVLPSYYREGLPRSTQEAMSLGKPIITTDWIGCRETVMDGVNGFLVPVRDPTSLAAAMFRFIERPALINSMGAASRCLAEQRYDASVINSTVLSAL